VTSKQPDIVFFSWDSLGWAEVCCYGDGVLRTADATDRRLAAEGLKLLNFNAEAQCTPSRSARDFRPWTVRICHRTLPKGSENILQGGSKWCGSLAAASST